MARKSDGGAVARTVVDEEELERLADSLHGGDDARREGLDVALLVEDRDDDAVGDGGLCGGGVHASGHLGWARLSTRRRGRVGTVFCAGTAFRARLPGPGRRRGEVPRA